MDDDVTALGADATKMALSWICLHRHCRLVVHNSFWLCCCVPPPILRTRIEVQELYLPTMTGRCRETPLLCIHWHFNHCQLLLYSVQPRHYGL